MSLVEQCYKEALSLLHGAVIPEGFTASIGGLYENEVWGRDGSITCLGANISQEARLLAPSRATLETLRRMQAPLGQIPNRIRTNPHSINFYALDGACWWIIAAASFSRATGDKGFLSSFWPSMKAAITWLKYQDVDNTALISSPPAADWMDSSLQRSGAVLYNNVLYYKALRCIAEVAQVLGEEESESREAQRVRSRINTLFWPTGMTVPEEWIRGWNTQFYEEVVDPERRYYLNFLSFESYDWHCDVLANCLAVLWDVADQQQTERILQYMVESRVAEPFPARVLEPTVPLPTPFWNPKIDLYSPREQVSLPFQYHNGGIWPWVGGFYVLTLEKAGRHEQAVADLDKLAAANKRGRYREWEFNEWLHGKTGAPMGTTLQALERRRLRAGVPGRRRWGLGGLAPASLQTVCRERLSGTQ